MFTLNVTHQNSSFASLRLNKCTKSISFLIKYSQSLQTFSFFISLFISFRCSSSLPFHWKAAFLCELPPHFKMDNSKSIIYVFFWATDDCQTCAQIMYCAPRETSHFLSFGLVKALCIFTPGTRKPLHTKGLCIAWYNPNNTRFNTITFDLSWFPSCVSIKPKPNDSLVKALTTWLYVLSLLDQITKKINAWR